MVKPAILAGGRIAGTWRLESRARTARLMVQPFTPVPPSSRDGLRAEADDIGRFLGVDIRFQMAS
jgi:hypothetical protein